MVFTDCFICITPPINCPMGGVIILCKTSCKKDKKMNKYERESIKYLQHKGYKVEPLHRNKRSSHLIILVDEVKISISSTPSDNRGMKILWDALV